MQPARLALILRDHRKIITAEGAEESPPSGDLRICLADKLNLRQEAFIVSANERCVVVHK